MQYFGTAVVKTLEDRRTASFFLPLMRGKKKLQEGIQQPREEEGKLNSAKCTYEKRPMYMHTKWFMQFRSKRCKKLCAHRYIVKASVRFV